MPGAGCEEAPSSDSHFQRLGGDGRGHVRLVHRVTEGQTSESPRNSPFKTHLGPPGGRCGGSETFIKEGGGGRGLEWAGWVHWGCRSAQGLVGVASS